MKTFKDKNGFELQYYECRQISRLVNFRNPIRVRLGLPDPVPMVIPDYWIGFVAYLAFALYILLMFCYEVWK